MEKEVTYKGKYPLDTVLLVLDMLNQKVEIRSIEKTTRVPEKTISNWKFGYTKIFGVHKQLNIDLELEALRLLEKGQSMPRIAHKLEVNYDGLRMFFKRTLGEQEYKMIKISNGSLPDSSRTITPELSYILGVMYGDGHFGVGQIRLGAKDKEFVGYFADRVKKWCGKEPSLVQFPQNGKPYYECYLSFKSAAEFILGLVKDRQVIPEDIFNSNDDGLLVNFVKGFSDSEGTIVTNERNRANFLKIYNQKRVVLEQVKVLMCKLGFDDRKLKVVVNNNAKGGNVYALRICYRDQLGLFHEKVGFTILRKQQKLNSCLQRK